jgi:cell division protein ZapD
LVKDNGIFVITYEFPINERIRTLLRLEDLYSRLDHYVQQSHPAEHHSAFLTMFELMEAANRADLKSDLLQELERQRQTLVQLRTNPHISQSALEQVLKDIEKTYNNLLGITSKFGQHIRDNEWLMLIKQRAIIPGGTSRFDLPSYYYWQNKPVESRRADLERWYAPMLPIKQGIDIVLNLLRNSAKSHTYQAVHGQFQQMSGGKIIQLIRLSLKANLCCTPELSANRYAINIRFTIPNNEGERFLITDQDIDFVLSYCAL